MKRILFIICCFAFFSISFLNQENLVEFPNNWPNIKYKFEKNELSQAKIDLGRVLFYDPILSKNNTTSCASCHSPYNAFTHVDHSLSHGIDDKIGTRNSPTLMNLAWHDKFMWDGAINHLDMQALAPISNPDEMAENIKNVIDKLNNKTLYKILSYNAFGDSMISSEKMLKSLGQFMITLISSNSKYDSVMRHQANFDTKEKNGYAIFQKHCNSCHTEPLFSNLQFENNGLELDSVLKDFGRMKITLDPKDSLKFKVPSLRNIEFSYPYMHDGRFRKLSEVINHYTTSIKHSPSLSEKLQNPILLNSNEKVDLIAFLLTLSDKQFLFNPKFAYPKEIISKLAKE
jgi:cytochrome c peroxidase